MKNAHDILSSIQCKPQFKKILHYKCIEKLLSTILPAIRKSVKHGYVHKNIFYITRLLLLSLTTNAQNPCLNDTIGLPPLSDLGTGSFQGQIGGLYSNGSNVMPLIHQNTGI